MKSNDREYVPSQETYLEAGRSTQQSSSFNNILNQLTPRALKTISNITTRGPRTSFLTVQHETPAPRTNFGLPISSATTDLTPRRELPVSRNTSAPSPAPRSIGSPS